MKKVILLGMTVAAYYIASMYRQMPLMVLAIAMLMLVVILFVLPRYLKRGIQISFSRQLDQAEKGQDKRYDILVENKGKLPVNHLTVSLHLYDEKGMLIQKYKLRSNRKEGINALSISLSVPHCGMYRLIACQVRVYDYLCAFSSAKEVQQQMSVMVLPRMVTMKFKLPYMELKGRQMEDSTRQKMRYSGSENREIRQMREYQNGDTVRHIHWNLSAKADRLWIKEYEKENDSFSRLLLDLRIPEGWKEESRDAFYELLSALIFGFLQADWGLSVCWYDSESKSFVFMEVEKAAQYHNMMARLYQTEFPKDGQADESYVRQQALLGNQFIKLNLSLECYYGEKIRFKFTYENLEQELSQPYLLSFR